MAALRFTIRREFVGKGKWTALPQAALKVWLTCPRCHHEYFLRHKFCGLPLGIEEVFRDAPECLVCKQNTQDSKLALGVADCPNCGLECRHTSQIVEEKDLLEPRPSGHFAKGPR